VNQIEKVSKGCAAWFCLVQQLRDATRDMQKNLFLVGVHQAGKVGRGGGACEVECDGRGTSQQTCQQNLGEKSSKISTLVFHEEIILPQWMLTH
jgi:hypothetical protein